MKTKLEIQQQIIELTKEVKSLENIIYKKKERIDSLGTDLIKFSEYKEGDIFNIAGKSYKLYGIRYDRGTSSLFYNIEEIKIKNSRKNLKAIQENALIERINNGSIIYVSPDTIPDKRIKIEAPKVISISDIKVNKQSGPTFEAIFEAVDEKDKKHMIYTQLQCHYKTDFLKYTEKYSLQFRRKDMIDKTYSYVMYSKYSGTYRPDRKRLYTENRMWLVSKFEFLEEKDIFERLLELS